MLKGKKILIGVSGSIAAYRVCDLIEQLKAEEAQVQCVMTQAAKHFITASTLRALSGRPVYSEMFEEHPFEGPLHTTLADDSDLIVVVPTSCNLIARLAVGLCNDLLTGIIIAAKKPILLVPAMNDNMYQHPLTQKNIRELAAIGYHFLAPEKGQLICGRYSIGHIASQQNIFSRIKELLNEKKKR